MTSTTTSGKDFLDILFDERNKDYGAYELRRKYDQRVRNAIIGTASFALVIVGGYALSNRLMASDNTHRVLPPVVLMPTPIDPLIEHPVTPPPPPLPPAAPQQVHTERFVVPVVARDVNEEDVPPRMDQLEHAAIGVTTTAGVDDDIAPASLNTGTGVVETIAPKPETDRNEVRTFVEISPEFPGGMEALSRYLSKSIRYPNIAAENDISGRVYVQFVVNYEGAIKDVKVVGNHLGGGLEEEAMRVVKAMPKWKPGRQNGQNVSVLYNLPIVFHLDR